MFGIYYKTALLLIFFGLGLIFSIVLFVQYRKTNEQSLKWLSILIFLSCLYVSPWMLGHAGWYAIDGYREFLFFFPFHQLFLIGPVIYFYVHSLLKPDFKLSKSGYLHFLPAATYFIYTLIVFITDAFILDEYYFYSDGRDKDLSPWYQILGTISIIGYTLLTYKEYEIYKNKILNEVSFAESIRYGWLKRFLVALTTILTLRVAFMILLPEWGDFGIKWWYYLAFSITFGYISFAGYTNGIIASFAYRPLSSESDENTSSELVSSEVEKWKKQIHSYVIEASAFRNSRLTLQDVANDLKTNTRIVSQTINQGFKMNFNDYINEARLEALKIRIAKNDHEKYTLLALAMECGFNSKTTFNRVFKSRTGMTPNDYLKQEEK